MMVKIKKETSTKVELYKHFYDYFGWTINSKHIIYIEDEDYRNGCTSIVKKCGQAILDSLDRLNKLSRANPFWEKTDHKPTIDKLDKFCVIILTKGNDKDALSLWTLAALHLLGCAEESYSLKNIENIGSHYWKLLYELNLVSSEEILYAAFYSYFYEHYGEYLFASFVFDIGLIDESLQFFQKYKISKFNSISKWSESIITILHNPDTPFFRYLTNR